jgi:hypothetical protein
VINEALDAMRIRFYKVIELSESLNEEARDRLLKRWKQEIGKMARDLIGPSVTEWMNWEDQVICF